MVSSSIRGFPSQMASTIASAWASLTPLSIANLRISAEYTLIFDSERFSPPSAFANTTPVLALSSVFPPSP